MNPPSTLLLLLRTSCRKRNVSRRGSHSATGEQELSSGDGNRQRQPSIDTTQSGGSVAGSISGEPEGDWAWRESAKYWLKKLFRPRTVNQLIGNLLLCSWIILAADQFFHALFIVSITFTCPAYNCRDYLTFATPTCAAGPLEAVQLIIQPFGSCLFIVATVNRFVNVYSRLSRRRFIALRIGTMLVCFVCMGMSAITAMTFVLTLSESTTPAQQAEGQRLLVFGDFITYQTLGIVAVFALVMGLQYIYEIRKEVTALKSPIATPSIFNAADAPNGTFSFLAVAATAPLDSTPESTADSSSPLPLLHLPLFPQSLSQHQAYPNPRPPHATMAQIKTILAHDFDLALHGAFSGALAPTNKNMLAKSPSAVMKATLQRAYHSDRRKSIVTVGCILVNIAIIVSFLFQHPYVAPTPEGAQKPSTLLDLAILSLVQKCLRPWPRSRFSS
ncbi:hypothetical protein BCR44DRAFT_1525537 [Catenaria anguillulae PL171]|uniref:Uncharacterized protein n=1 Tax=Catenaria anguillulae PL171 TaxID=765915 RepID=A0A1Y2H4W7_9FUNG|nr:hypothetical protein BCR44DRAFT_1525537 [Catenaria anguillulae PL171]